MLMLIDLKGDVITTPFSFVATTSSLVTNNLNPVFCDINKYSLNLDEKKIEPLIKTTTTGIVPVHSYGNACNIEVIQTIAKQNNLKVIYDAAHTFGIKYKKNSILSYGNISTISFHATKLFHTIEGGALIINDDALVEKARYLINFGIKNQEEIPHVGINAKMNEFEAAMGLCLLDDIDLITSKRKEVYEFYKNNLKDFIQIPKQNPDSTQNYSYFPIIFKSEEELLTVQKALNEKGIYPRRYFYPSLDTLSYIKDKQTCPISRNISLRILCLPIYAELNINTQKSIISLIKKYL